MNKTQKYLLGGGAALLAIGGTAVASSYYTRTSMAPTAPAPVAQSRPVHHATQPRQMAAAQPGQPLPPACDDHNVIGTVGGAVAGGVLGNQFGKGGGRTVATVGGVAGGAYLGNKYIPTRGVACQ